MKGGSRGTGYLVAAGAYVLLITALSHIPGSALSRLGISVWDKALHVAEFLPLGFLVAMFAFRRWGGRARPVVVVAAVTAMGVVIGALDEWHQLFVPGRTASVGDVIADGIGTLAGALLALAITRWPWRTT